MLLYPKRHKSVTLRANVVLPEDHFHTFVVSRHYLLLIRTGALELLILKLLSELLRAEDSSSELL